MTHKHATRREYYTLLTKPRPKQGWQCPRCRRVWSPWITMCCCNHNEPYRNPALLPEPNEGDTQ